MSPTNSQQMKSSNRLFARTTPSMAPAKRDMKQKKRV